MRYVSTRSAELAGNFEQVLVEGLAPDGGLYIPETWPQFSTAALRDMQGLNYSELAFRVISPFVGSTIAADELRVMIEAAYGSFTHTAVTPLKQLGTQLWLLELFHGPTLSFKDVAMQLIARMLDKALAARGERATIICATSGDTGAAAAQAFAGSTQATTVILHPKGLISDVQRLQMTTAQPPVYNIAIEGSFDDAQAIVKSLFNDRAFAKGVHLSGVNSINWARIVAQTVYYFASALQLGAPDRSISYTVPTGNFGDIFAGYVAKCMGLPIERLVIASNANDILPRTFETGRYEVLKPQATSSPAMDIQVSSNFERLLYLAGGRDTAQVRAAMGALAQQGGFTLRADALSKIRSEFDAGRADAAQTLAAITQIYAQTGEIIDPHTAVGLSVALRQKMPAPMVCLATAHPAKFSDAIQTAIGRKPAVPEKLIHLLEAEERYTVLPNAAAAVKDYILSIR